MSSPGVTPEQITSGALLAQVFVVAIMLLGAQVIRVRSYSFEYSQWTREHSGLGWTILFFAVLTSALLGLSDAFSNAWKPLFGVLEYQGIGWSSAIWWVYTLNILGVTIMVAQTGGSYISPFSPLFFLLPTLAIFLREPLSHILWYLIEVSLCFTIGLLLQHNEPLHLRSYRIAYAIVSLLCFALAVFIGYMTRPI